MMVLEFEPDQHNYIVVGEEPFFVLKTCDDRVMVCPDACPHRGGPLHLGEMDCRTRSLTCPWHDTTLMETALAKRGVPSVANRQTITAIFTAEPETPVRRHWKRIIANER